MQDHRSQSQLSALITVIVLLLFVLAMCSGCATSVPVVAKFPGPPGQSYLQACPNLQKLSDTPQLSDVSRTINTNYSTYYECAVKLDTWIRWYGEQQIIFKSTGK
jgi:hypothetical protein